MIHLSKTPAQKKDLENLLQQLFASYKNLTHRYTCATSKGRACNRDFALSEIYDVF